MRSLPYLQRFFDLLGINGPLLEPCSAVVSTQWSYKASDGERSREKKTAIEKCRGELKYDIQVVQRFITLCFCAADSP